MPNRNLHSDWYRKWGHFTATGIGVRFPAGLESLERSSDCIQLHQGDKELFQASMNHIQRIRSHTIDGLSEPSEPHSVANKDKVVF